MPLSVQDISRVLYRPIFTLLHIFTTGPAEAFTQTLKKSRRSSESVLLFWFILRLSIITITNNNRF